MNDKVFERALAGNGINGLESGEHEYDLNRKQFARVSTMGSGLMQDDIIFATLVMDEVANLPPAETVHPEKYCSLAVPARYRPCSPIR